MDPFLAFLIQNLFGGASDQGGLFSTSQPGTINSFLNSLIAPAEQAQATPAPLQQALPFYSDQFTPPPPPPAASPYDISRAALEGIILNPDGSFMIIDPETGRRLSPLDFGQQQFDARQAGQALQDDIRPALQQGSANTITVAETLAQGFPAGGTPFENFNPLFDPESAPNQRYNEFGQPIDFFGNVITTVGNPNNPQTISGSRFLLPPSEASSGSLQPRNPPGKSSRGKDRLPLEEFNSPLSPPSSDFFSNFLASGALTGGPRVSRGIADNPFPLGQFQTQNQSNAGFFFPNSPGFPGFF